MPPVLLYATGVNELLLLLIGTLLYISPRAGTLIKDRTFAFSLPLLMVLVAEDAQHPGLGRIFLLFLKIGSVLYGSGYVLIAFLQRDLVDQRHWLTQQQLKDAVAVGQVTPGPLFTTATFIGYVVGGWIGAVAATIGIFLPGFVLVWMTHGIVDRVRASASLAHLLDGLNLASNALLIGVLITLVRNLDSSAMNGVLVGLALLALATRRLGPTPVLILAGPPCNDQSGLTG